MLVLSGKVDDRFMISDDVVVTIVEIHGDRIRLGFEAPKEVSVDREKIYNSKHGIKQEAPVSSSI